LTVSNAGGGGERGRPAAEFEQFRAGEGVTIRGQGRCLLPAPPRCLGKLTQSGFEGARHDPVVRVQGFPSAGLWEAGAGRVQRSAGPGGHEGRCVGTFIPHSSLRTKYGGLWGEVQGLDEGVGTAGVAVVGRAGSGNRLRIGGGLGAATLNRVESSAGRRALLLLVWVKGHAGRVDPPTLVVVGIGIGSAPRTPIGDVDVVPDRCEHPRTQVPPRTTWGPLVGVMSVQLSVEGS